MPFDAVLGYHLTPHTCGIARFNSQLARRMGVEVVGIFSRAAADFRSPLVSIKLSEMSGHIESLENWLADAAGRRYSLFLHDYEGSALEQALVSNAERVICGNTEIAAALERAGHSIETAYCPGTVEPAGAFGTVDISVFSFGMANKLNPHHYERLRRLLEDTGGSYCLYLSVALHEDARFEEVFDRCPEVFLELFGPRLHFLGFLSDAAVAHYIRTTDLFAAFFPRGVRANNTSVNAAMQMGAAVITNLDHHSPRAFRHGYNIIDINRLDSLCEALAGAGSIGRAARQTVERRLSWSGLIDLLAGPAGGDVHSD